MLIHIFTNFQCNIPCLLHCACLFTHFLNTKLNCIPNIFITLTFNQFLSCAIIAWTVQLIKYQTSNLPTHSFLLCFLNRNPSSNSLVLSETGSLDRAKAALERRKKAQLQDTEVAPGRVEVTRVNPDDLIADLLKSTNLEQADDSAECELRETYNKNLWVVLFV